MDAKTCDCNDPKRKKIILAARIVLFIILSILIFVVANLYTNSAGAYSKELNIAMLFTKDYDAYTNISVATHEIGHYVYFNKLSQSQRDEYEKLFAGSTVFVSDYARTNAQEDFAEMFVQATSCQINPEFLVLQDKNKQEFFKKNIEEMIK